MTEAQLLATTSGFMGVPWATSTAGAKAAILGVPFDCGTHAFRIGSRQGPASIREQSRLVRAYDDAVQRAILKSSPLPKPTQPELFVRTLQLRFRPFD